ncbi:MAG: transglutaminase-like domain-containing protein [Thermoproteota archaeon]|nr:transglutaminase-like domain-containing protein [Thermoproteota archaeon]
MFNLFKIDNSNFFPYTKDAFTLYKKVTSQYKEARVLNYVKRSIPEKIALELQIRNNNPTNEIHSLKPLLHWFKNDFMRWMNKNISCEQCKNPMYFEYMQGNSWMLRAIENYSCTNCKFQINFPRTAIIEEIADYRIGRCSEWSMLFGAILNSLSIETRLVHDFLDHCWNESLVGGKWIHIDSTLDYPISLDNPYYYEKNWGKKYHFVLAFSDATVEDVTFSYYQEWNNILQRRSKQKFNIDKFKKIYFEL